MSDPSERLVLTLTACSMTPRSGQRYVAELARLRRRREEALYAEAKLALAHGNVAAARLLFAQCPRDYKKVTSYRRQCDDFERLCASGLVRRPEAETLREDLAEYLHETSVVVDRYADALWRKGYRTVDATLADVEALADDARMRPGHRRRLVQSLEDAVPWWECAWYRGVRAVQQCGGLPRVTSACLSLKDGGKEEEEGKEDGK